MAVRAIRGATHLAADDADEMREAVVELVTAMLARNGLGTEDLISVLFTATPDLMSAFPAGAARALDIGDVPLICAQEINVTGAMPRVVRVMAHVECDMPRADVAHVYLRGAEALRTDLAQ
jgi:chorismate mutase